MNLKDLSLAGPLPKMYSISHCIVCVCFLEETPYMVHASQIWMCSQRKHVFPQLHASFFFHNLRLSCSHTWHLKGDGQTVQKSTESSHPPFPLTQDFPLLLIFCIGVVHWLQLMNQKLIHYYELKSIVYTRAHSLCWTEFLSLNSKFLDGKIQWASLSRCSLQLGVRPLGLLPTQYS